MVLLNNAVFPTVSTHSRPKAAGSSVASNTVLFSFQHTAARRRLEHRGRQAGLFYQFQHTAARRRLDAATGGMFTRTTFQHTAARRRLD